jgi:hypothetical protein
MTINVTRPEGNVFCILGAAKNYQRQLKRKEIANPILNEVLNGYTEMTYDGILDKLESTGLFRFTGRK